MTCTEEEFEEAKHNSVDPICLAVSLAAHVARKLEPILSTSDAHVIPETRKVAET